MRKLEGRVAVVTGAAMGNGEGIARVMAKYGAHVALWDINDKVYETADAIVSDGHKATPYKVDVRNYDQCKAAADDIIEKLGKIDVLCNNAGVSKYGPFLETSEELKDLHIDVNIRGVWNCTKAVLPNMKENSYGRIVNISSVTGPIVVDVGSTIYAATKAAEWGFTKALALEVVKDNITVNAICPGMIRTPMVVTAPDPADQERWDRMIGVMADLIPMGRLGTIFEIGELAAFLGSDESTYITGTQVVIDGGNSLPEVTWPS